MGSRFFRTAIAFAVTDSSAPPPSARPSRENLLLNLACNIAAPALILGNLSTEERLGPVVAMLVALAFPLGYGLRDFVRRRKFNFFSAIGFFNTLLTGGFALMELDGLWFAVKEASVPTVIGLIVLISMRTARPLVREFLYNDQVFDVPRIDAALTASGTRPQFDRLLRQASWLTVGSFAVSATMNFLLARWLLQGPAGSAEFNAQLAKMQWLSWPVIVVPSMGVMMLALFLFFRGLRKLTGLGLEDLLHPQPAKKS